MRRYRQFSTAHYLFTLILPIAIGFGSWDKAAMSRQLTPAEIAMLFAVPTAACLLVIATYMLLKARYQVAVSANADQATLLHGARELVHIDAPTPWLIHRGSRIRPGRRYRLVLTPAAASERDVIRALRIKPEEAQQLGIIVMHAGGAVRRRLIPMLEDDARTLYIQDY